MGDEKSAHTHFRILILNLMGDEKSKIMVGVIGNSSREREREILIQWLTPLTTITIMMMNRQNPRLLLLFLTITRAARSSLVTTIKHQWMKLSFVGLLTWKSFGRLDQHKVSRMKEIAFKKQAKLEGIYAHAHIEIDTKAA
ncbi:hypothetical protein Fot_23618 [Forsythia ovata]|uniref:Uncharacterized protein n=1 Tax=Forsythia ovata TaxID=205694 RepID=A0ABD1V140_9LAMI